MSSNRYQDSRAEKILSSYMDKNLYTRICRRNEDHFRRFSDEETQRSGIDVALEYQGDIYNIDEKASLYYGNTKLPTFALEIDSMQYGHEEPIIGWFVNDDLRTDYYMLIWPNIVCKKERYKFIRKDVSDIQGPYDFLPMETILIEKNILRASLEEDGWGKTQLLEYAKLIREFKNGSTSAECMQAEFKQKETSIRKNINDELNIQLSLTLAEEPVNIIVSKDRLLRLAKAVFLISDDGYAQIHVDP